MPDPKGDKLYVNLSASQTRKRLKGFGHGVNDTCDTSDLDHAGSCCRANYVHPLYDLVGDRENNRVQVFDAGGKLLDVWPGFAPYGLAFDQEGNLYVADGRANKVLRLDANGKVIGSWGGRGTEPGQFNLPHMLATDTGGNLYIAEVQGKRFQKLTRR